MNQEKINEILELWESPDYNGNKDEFANVDLRNAYLRNAYLGYVNLSYANLINVDLRNAYLRNANLSYANLSYADLRNADLFNANLSYANLSYAYLRNANLSYADLRNAKFSDKLIIKNNKRSYYQGSDYYCWIFENIIKIGCEVHSYQEWKNFTDKEILKMDGKRALKFWKKEKEIILKIHDNL